MGFIEDERRKAAAEAIVRKREIEDSIRQDSIREKALKAEKAANEAKKIAEEALNNKAKQNFEQSGLKGMINELQDIGTFRQANSYTQNGTYVVDINVSRGKISLQVKADGSIGISGEYKKGQTDLKPYEALGMSGRRKLENALEKACKHPEKPSPEPSFDEIDRASSGYTHDSCLCGDSFIGTPNGTVSVKNLKSGDLVWTVDGFGNRVQSVIIRTNRSLVSRGHKMAHITLKDGRKLIVSPGHPTIDNKELGSLRKGQILDNSKISSIKIMPYQEKYTYDILPSGETGGYWANGILIGSTLSASFKQIQQDKLALQIMQV